MTRRSMASQMSVARKQDRSPRHWLGAVLAFGVIAACSQGSTGQDTAEVSDGAESLYQANCGSCHGADLSGEPNWRTPNQDGAFPAPPHDSTGHTWHHSDQVLTEIVRDGGRGPESRMPSFGSRLSDVEIQEILDFIKSSWDPEQREYQRLLSSGDRESGG